jgi:hypothetical protein
MSKRRVITTKSALYGINWKSTRKEQIKEYNANYALRHDLAAKQRIYDRSRAEYKLFAKSLLRMLNNFFDEPIQSI